MSRSRTDTFLIADRYAQALFALAEGKARAAVEADLTVLAGAIRADSGVVALLAHPLLTRAKKAEAMRVLLTAKKADKLTVDTVAKLADAGRLSLLPEVADAFLAKCAAARGEVVATVTSAHALSAQESEAVSAVLEKATGAQVRVVLKQDAGLLGGLKVNLGPKEFDMSVAGSLARMRRALVGAAL